MSNKTIDYYNKNAESFVNGTKEVDFSVIQKMFTELLDPGATILDFGCGSGRDTKAFLERGFNVDAIDGSEELCKIASEYTGIEVKHMYFHELSDKEKYDGIWACASILHVPIEELPDILLKIEKALKFGGVLYTSFKYGEFEGERNGRFFTDMNEDIFSKLLAKSCSLKIEKQWTTSDVRPGRDEEKWLNLILRKDVK